MPKAHNLSRLLPTPADIDALMLERNKRPRHPTIRQDFIEAVRGEVQRILKELRSPPVQLPEGIVAQAIARVEQLLRVRKIPPAYVIWPEQSPPDACWTIDAMPNADDAVGMFRALCARGMFQREIMKKRHVGPFVKKVHELLSMEGVYYIDQPLLETAVIDAVGQLQDRWERS